MTSLKGERMSYTQYHKYGNNTDFWLMTWHEQRIELKNSYETKTPHEKSVLYNRIYQYSQSWSVLILTYQPGRERQWLKEEEKECLVIVMVTGESNKLSNSKLFKQKNFMFSHIWSSMGIPGWGKSLSRRDLGCWFYPVAFLDEWHPGLPIASTEACKNGKTMECVCGVAYSPSMERLLSLLVSFHGRKLQSPDHTYLQEWLGKMVKPGAKE